MKITVHGITFNRKGKCKRCGACEKPKCPHFTHDRNGRATCLVYGKGDYLEWRCDVFPDSPFCRVVSQGICGFRFKPVTKDDAAKFEEYKKIWRI